MRKTLTLLLLCLIGYVGLSQTQSRTTLTTLGVRLTSSNPAGFPARYGDTISYAVTVQNTGDSIFSGPIGIRVDVTNDSIPIVSNDTLGNFRLNQGLFPNDTFQYTVIDVITPARYGGNGGVVVVVVWPAVANQPNVIIENSHSVTFPLDMSQSINWGWEEAYNEIELYPNPIQDRLIFRYGTLKPKIEYVRIFSAVGRLLEEFERPPNSLELQGYRSGLYYLILIGDEGKQATFRLLKQ